MVTLEFLSEKTLLRLARKGCVKENKVVFSTMKPIGELLQSLDKTDTPRVEKVRKPGREAPVSVVHPQVRHLPHSGADRPKQNTTACPSAPPRQKRKNAFADSEISHIPPKKRRDKANRKTSQKSKERVARKSGKQHVAQVPSNFILNCLFWQSATK